MMQSSAVTCLLLLVLCVISSQSNVAATASILGSLEKYDAIRAKNLSSNVRTNNFDVVQLGNGQEVGICHLVDMNRYSMLFGEQRTRVAFPNAFPLAAKATVALALEHMNTGDGSIVPELEGLDQRCNIRFTAESLDTQGMENVALDRVIDVVDRDGEKADKPLPCGFVGAFRSTVTKATSVLTGLKGYPQIGTISVDTKLNEKDVFPLFGRVNIAADDYGAPALDFISNNLNIKHLAIVYTEDDVGSSFASGILAAATKLHPNMVVRSVSIPTFPDEYDILAAVLFLKETGFRFFMGIVDFDSFLKLTHEAYNQGISGNGRYNWIVSTSEIPIRFARSEYPHWYEPNPELDSAVDSTVDGLIAIAATGGIPGMDRYEALQRALSSIGGSEKDMAYLEKSIPAYPMEPSYKNEYSADTFKTTDFSTFLAQFYDAAVLLGLSACQAQSASMPFVDGSVHYKTTLNTSFTGASGRVQLNEETGSRQGASSQFVVSNLRRIGSNSNSSLFEHVQTGYCRDSWVETEKLIFNGGTLNIPSDLPAEEIVRNHIRISFRLAGLFMAALVILMSLMFACFTECHRNSKVIKASQPFFLHFICLGTFLMGTAIVPLSIDDEFASERVCSAACSVFPWLLSLGWVIAFSALYTKTHRVNRVFHNPRFQRITVTVADVVRPMVGLLSVTIIVLSLMSTLAPVQWEREIVSVDRFGRPSESFGSCTAEGWLPFAIVLVSVNLGTLTLALYETYVARHLSTEFAESESIAKAMICILQVCFIGFPVLYIAESNKNAQIFVQSGIVFIICMSLLLFIFVPKIKFRLIASSSRRAHASKYVNVVDSAEGSHRTKPEAWQSSECSDGANVIDHPKLRQDWKLYAEGLEQRIKELEPLIEPAKRVEELTERLQELENRHDRVHDLDQCQYQEHELQSKRASASETTSHDPSEATDTKAAQETA